MKKVETREPILLAEITAAIQAKDKEQLKHLQNKLKRFAWLRAWQEKGGKMSDFIDKPNPVIQFTD